MLAARDPDVITLHDLAVVGQAFGFAGDVATRCASLAGFGLGVLYTEPHHSSMRTMLADATLQVSSGGRSRVRTYDPLLVRQVLFR